MVCMINFLLAVKVSKNCLELLSSLKKFQFLAGKAATWWPHQCVTAAAAAFYSSKSKQVLGLGGLVSCGGPVTNYFIRDICTTKRVPISICTTFLYPKVITTYKRPL